MMMNHHEGGRDIVANLIKKVQIKTSQKPPIN